MNFGILICLFFPHLSSSLTDSLHSLNLLCYSKTNTRFMQDGRKAVWSILYVSVAFFPSLKNNFIAYHSSKVSSRPDCGFEIHHLWQSGFSRVYSNYSYGPPHMAKQKQDDQFEHTYSSYVRIRDVALKTCQRRWTIGGSGERGSGISVLVAQHDDDDSNCCCSCLFEPEIIKIGQSSRKMYSNNILNFLESTTFTILFYSWNIWTCLHS